MSFVLQLYAQNNKELFKIKLQFLLTRDTRLRDTGRTQCLASRSPASRVFICKLNLLIYLLAFELKGIHYELMLLGLQRYNFSCKRQISRLCTNASVLSPISVSEKCVLLCIHKHSTTQTCNHKVKTIILLR